ncbi:MAG: M48 family metallopeptidase, partial [Candidatus Egerieousia sp.]|nr:M48 family metallopeptidase [Candidatus Egerieousia sp.]
RTAQIAAAMRTLHKRPFAYQRIAIKLNKTNWGSCSAKNNLNLNLALPLLPDALRDYVIIHELCHLEHHNHSAEFHRLLNSSCLALLGRPERELVKELRGYCI